MPSLFYLIGSDLRAKAQWCYESTRWSAIVKTLLTDGTAAMIWYRLMQGARRWRLMPLEMIFNKLNTIFGNCIIGRGAEFGAGFVLIHSTGVVINGSVRGGRDIKVEHQVTIGAERGLSPILGDDGGIAITWDRGGTYDFINTFPIGQFYAVAAQTQMAPLNEKLANEVFGAGTWALIQKT